MNTPRNRARQRGLSLVELMIAMTIGLGLVAAMATLVVNNGRSLEKLGESSRQIENGRYALELLVDDIGHAGYYGELGPRSATWAEPAPCAATVATLGWDPATMTLPVAVTGLDAAPACVPDWLPGTGVIAVRRVSTAPRAASAVTPGNPAVQVSHCAADPVGSRFAFSDTAAGLPLRLRDCATPSPARRFVSRMYYVAECAVCGRDKIPTLKRVEMVDGAWRESPVTEGIEEVQFEYGFDGDGDGTVDEFRTDTDGVAGSPMDRWENVMAVRIHLLSRTLAPSAGHVDEKRYDLGLHGTRGPYGDAYKRRAYSTVVHLENPAGLRR